jgi:hypothetical protein
LTKMIRLPEAIKDYVDAVSEGTTRIAKRARSATPTL